MSIHDDPLKYLVEQMRADRIHLEAPVQETLAGLVQGAYRTGSSDGTPVRDIKDMPLSLKGLSSAIPGRTPSTVGEASAVLMKSFYPTMLQFADKAQNKNAHIGEIVSEQAANFHDNVLSWDPSKGSLATYMAVKMGGAARTGSRAMSAQGQGLNVDVTSEMADPGNFSAEPESIPWYKQLPKQMGGNSVPTSLYVPKGQSLIVNGSLNPEATGLRSGNVFNSTYEQASLTGEQVSSLGPVMDKHYELSRRGKAGGSIARQAIRPQLEALGTTTPAFRTLQKDMRSLSTGLAGMETIGGNILGGAANSDNVFHTGQYTSPQITWGQTDVNRQVASYRNGTMEPEREKGFIGPMENVQEYLPKHRGTLRSVIGNPTHSGAPGNTGAMPIIAYGPKGYSTQEPLQRDASYSTSAQEDVYNALGSFSESGDKMQIDAAKEIGARGFLGKGFVGRWNGSNAKLAQSAKKKWSTARRTVDAYNRTEESVTQGVEFDSSIPDQFKSDFMRNFESSGVSSYKSGTPFPSDGPAIAEPEWDQAPTAKTANKLADNFVSITGGSGQSPTSETPQMVDQTTAPETTPVVIPESVMPARAKSGPVYQKGKGAKALAANAAIGRKVLQEKFPTFVSEHLGKDESNTPAYDAWVNSLPADEKVLFQTAHDALLAEQKAQGGQTKGLTQYSQMIQQNGWKGVAKPTSASSVGSNSGPSQTPSQPLTSNNNGGNKLPPKPPSVTMSEPEDDGWSISDEDQSFLDNWAHENGNRRDDIQAKVEDKASPMLGPETQDDQERRLFLKKHQDNQLKKPRPTKRDASYNDAFSREFTRRSSIPATQADIDQDETDFISHVAGFTTNNPNQSPMSKAEFFAMRKEDRAIAGTKAFLNGDAAPTADVDSDNDVNGEYYGVDQAFPPGSRYAVGAADVPAERGDYLSSTAREGMGRGPQGQRLSTLDALKSGYANASLGIFAGKEHAVYGAFSPTMMDAETGVAVAGKWRNTESGDVTISEETAARGQELYRQSGIAAVGMDDMEGLDEQEIAATLHKRVTGIFQKKINDFADRLEKSEDPNERASAASIRKQLGAVAYGLNNEASNINKRILGLERGPGDLAHSAIPSKNVDELNSHIDNDPQLKTRLRQLFPGVADDKLAVTAMSEGQKVVMGTDAYDIGTQQSDDGKYGYGGRRESNFAKSLYQTDFGRMMMAGYMGKTIWAATGGSVLKTAEEYGKSQAAYASFANYGEGQAGGAQLSASRAELGAEFAGRIAHDQFGFISEASYALRDIAGGEGFLRGANDLKMGAGVGALAGLAAWSYGSAALGMTGAAALTAALPVAGVVAAAVALPLIGGEIYNAATGQSGEDGWSIMNSVRWGAVRTVEMAEDYSPQAARNNALHLLAPGIGGIQNLMMSDGSKQDEYMQANHGMSTRDYVSQSALGDLLGKSGVNWLFPQITETQQTIQNVATRISEDTGLVKADILPTLGKLQVALGGFDESQDPASLSTKMSNEFRAKHVIERAGDLGLDPSVLISGASNLAQMQGVLEGTPEYGDLLMNYAELDYVDQQKATRDATRSYQRYAQLSPYLEGGNAEAYQMSEKFGISTMAQTQALQQNFSQVQSAGELLSPAVATSMAGFAMQMTPNQSMAATQVASSMQQTGAGSVVGNYSTVAQSIIGQNFGISMDPKSSYNQTTIAAAGFGVKGDAIQTENFIQGVASGNQYALSDYGRMADIGVLQSIDPNGLQTGLKDMSGLLAYARQDILKSPGLSGSATLAGLGMNFANTSESSLLTGGLWGYEASYTSQMNGLSNQSLNLQSVGLAQQKSFLWGDGGSGNPSADSSWGLQTQMNAVQWGSQLSSFGYSQTMMDLQHGYQQEGAEADRSRRDVSNDYSRWSQSFNYQSSLIQRGYANEDYQYNTQMRSLQQGWGAEDINEKIRRSSGYERSLLIKQRDRETLSNNLTNEQADTQHERQGEMWAREDERYEKGVAYNEQMIAFDTERFERGQEQNEEMYLLQKEHLAEQIATATELHELQLAAEAGQREYQIQQIENSEASLAIQIQSQAIQQEYAKNMTIISHTQTEMEASLKKITAYSPSFSRMLTDFLKFLEDASRLPAPTLPGSNRITQ